MHRPQPGLRTCDARHRPVMDRRARTHGGPSRRIRGSDKAAARGLWGSRARADGGARVDARDRVDGRLCVDRRARAVGRGGWHGDDRAELY